MSKNTNQISKSVRSRNANREASGGSHTVHVGGNVTGIIVNGDKNDIQYEVNNIYGAVINNYDSRPAVKPWDVKPQPPRLPTDFVGRETELKELEQRIKARNAVLLYGHEGIGKTTLIRKAANSDAATAMPDGVIFLDAVEEQNQSLGFEDLLQQLFDALYESNPPLKVNKADARTHLSNTKPLVLIDRFDIPAKFLRTIPDYFPKGSVVVTTQGAIPIEGFESIGLAQLSRDDSMRLLSRISGVDRNTGSSPIMDEICTLLADVPLAITTIAKVIREKRTILPDALSQVKRLLSPSPDNIQAAIERSYAVVYSLLNREERDALMMAAVASGISIGRATLESIVGTEAINSLESLEILKANSPRLRLPDGLRQSIRSASKNASTFHEKLLDRLTKQLATRALDFDFISDELGNLLGLIRWAEGEKRWADVIKLGKALDPYLTLRGLWDAWQKVLQQVLTAANQLSDKAVRAWALHQLGTREAGYGNLSQAKDFLEQARDIRKSIGDTTGAAYTQHNLWALFPPLPIPTDRLGPSALRWIIAGLIAVAVIIAVLIIGPKLWATYTNHEYNFEFKYPRDGVLTEYSIASEPLVASINLPSESNDIYEKHLDVIANINQKGYPCQITINPENWVVEPVTLNDIEFLRAAQKTPLERKGNYEVYATKRDENTWVCLVFSYSPRGSTAGQSEDQSSETEIFLGIASTFRWLEPSPITTVPSGVVSTTLTPSRTKTNTPTLTITPTPTQTPTPTSTSTPTVTPTATNTPCAPNTTWPIYIVQSGDTLSQISLWYSDLSITVLDLQKANCKETTDLLRGERLYVPRTPPPASITGYVFSDPNNNRIQDAGEQRLPKVTVTLTNANGDVVATTITNADGVYQFSNLAYGQYQVFQYYIFVKPSQVAVRNFGVAPVP